MLNGAFSRPARVLATNSRSEENGMEYQIVVRLVVSFVCLVAAFQAWSASRALDAAERRREAAGKMPVEAGSGTGGHLRFFSPLEVELTEVTREGAIGTVRFGHPDLAHLVGIGSVSVVETDCFSDKMMAYRVGDAPPGTLAAEEVSVSGEPASPAVCLYPGTGIVPVTGAAIAENVEGFTVKSGCTAIAY